LHPELLNILGDIIILANNIEMVNELVPVGQYELCGIKANDRLLSLSFRLDLKSKHHCPILGISDFGNLLEAND